MKHKIAITTLFLSAFLIWGGVAQASPYCPNPDGSDPIPTHIPPLFKVAHYTNLISSDRTIVVLSEQEMLRIADENNHEFNYDHLGRKTSAIGHNPQIRDQYGYTADENIVEHHWAYDSAGRLWADHLNVGGIGRDVAYLRPPSRHMASDH